ncbi:MAG: hypothetical protein ACP5EP_12555 [Acidobacteriaceae bacterium]
MKNLFRFLLPLLLFSLQIPYVRANTHPPSNENIINVDANLMDVAKGYAEWMKAHSASFPKGTMLRTQGPTLDFYSTSGVSIFYGDGSEPGKSVSFLRALPGDIPQGSNAKTGQIRPTLKEAIDMIPALKPYEATILAKAKQKYVIFATTSDLPHSKAQNDAVQQLVGHARKYNIFIVQVWEHIEKE